MTSVTTLEMNELKASSTETLCYASAVTPLTSSTVEHAIMLGSFLISANKNLVGRHRSNVASETPAPGYHPRWSFTTLCPVSIKLHCSLTEAPLATQDG